MDMESSSIYSLVPLAGGLYSVRSDMHGETFHPKVGPETEARCVYFKPMRIEDRLKAAEGPFCVWDIGLGSAGNVLNLIRDHGHIANDLELDSFDATLEPLRFGLAKASLLKYMDGFEFHVDQLIQTGITQFKLGELRVTWRVHLGDIRNGYDAFPSLKREPQAVLYDPYSPAKNPELWSLKAFENLRKHLNIPCSLATYSRSTCVRVAMLCAGFYVGKGGEVGEKEETTVAATHSGLIEPLLDAAWLVKVMN